MSLSELAAGPSLMAPGPDAGPAPGAHLDPLDHLNSLLARAVDVGGSDLHLAVGLPPAVRLHGDLRPLPGLEPLVDEQVTTMIRRMLSLEQWERFARDLELDLAYTIPEVGRFRVNVYQQRGSLGAAFRVIPTSIRDLDSLGLPPAVSAFSQLHRGLVLVTGPTGSGKSTTLASLLDMANRTRSAHIMTVEDPIEFVHRHGTCLVNQREVGSDTKDFGVALRHALRQDPDIILVGELRDLETTAVAVSAAETGHLVLATLHTRSAATTVDRMIDIFPTGQQHQIRTQLAGCLEGVVAQALAPTSDGRGRAVVAEVMVATPAIRNLIREAKVHQIPTAMQSSGDLGMITFDQHLAARVQEGVIDMQTAISIAHQPEELRRLARW